MDLETLKWDIEDIGGQILWNREIFNFNKDVEEEFVAYAKNCIIYAETQYMYTQGCWLHYETPVNAYNSLLALPYVMKNFVTKRPALYSLNEDELFHVMVKVHGKNLLKFFRWVKENHYPSEQWIKPPSVQLFHILNKMERNILSGQSQNAKTHAILNKLQAIPNLSGIVGSVKYTISHTASLSSCDEDIFPAFQQNLTQSSLATTV